MAWDDTPPTESELKTAKLTNEVAWDSLPPDADQPKEESVLRQLGRATVDTVLPLGGAAAAAILAGPETLGLGSIPAGAAGYVAGKQAARLANGYLFGDDTGAKTPLDLAKQTGEDFGMGLMAEAGGQVAGNALKAGAEQMGPMLSKGADAVGGVVGNAAKKVRKFAADMAVNSTGATGVQASKFADDAGEELLDRGIVTFGANQKAIARKAQSAMDEANGQITGALNSLDAKGVRVDPEQLAAKIEEKITQMRTDPSKADVTRQLQTELENLQNAIAAKRDLARQDIVARMKATDPSDVETVKALQQELAALKEQKTSFGMNEAESIKRGYQRKAGNWMDPEKGMTGKEMYQTYRGAVEDAAMAANPETAAAFKEGKETYGLLAPIQEAAERRAMTTQQSPMGGFLDMTSGALAASKTGNPWLAVPAAVTRRVVSPRVASSIAVTSNAASKGLKQASEFLMRSPQFAKLAAENPRAFQQAALTLARKTDPMAALPAAASNNELNELDRDSSRSSTYSPERTPPNDEDAKQKFIEGN